MDLGLSLSWAPQRVREEALLSYNNQNPGVGMGGGGGGSGSATTSRVRTRWRGHGGGVDEEGRLDRPVTRSASGVAEAFREALGDAAYGTFKTCKSFIVHLPSLLL